MNLAAQSLPIYPHLRERLLCAAFEDAAIGLGICGLDGRLVEANRALKQMLGYAAHESDQKNRIADNNWEKMRSKPELHSPEAIIGPASELDPFALTRSTLEELQNGEKSSIEIEKWYRRLDGSVFWGHLTLSVAHCHPPSDFLIAALSDQTERKQIEEQLRQAEKMEVIGRLTGGIAHDFNNLLTGILLYCDLLSAEVKSGDRSGVDQDLSTDSEPAEVAPSGMRETAEPASLLVQHVEEVRRAGEEGAALTRQLLAIARKQSSEPRSVAINELVRSTEKLLRTLLGEQIELNLDLAPALDAGLSPAVGMVLADPVQLRQVLLNLVLNARDALTEGGRISVRTLATRFPEGETRRESLASTRDHNRAVALIIEDNGCGMDAATRSRLFEPFFTTKKAGQGTGLGLATVQRIVCQAAGAITVTSEPGLGTKVEVLLPALTMDKSRALKRQENDLNLQTQGD